MASSSQTNTCFILKPIDASSFLLLALLLLLLPCAFPLAWSGSMDPSRSDLQALQSIKAELVDSRGALRTWVGNISGACSGGWVGIECSPKAQVVSIQLPWKGLGGRISDTVGQLHALRRLSLHDNVISGSIPRSLGLLPKLRGLYLFNNRLSGSIPASIFSSTHLRIVHLGNNSLSGQIPPPLSNSTKMSRLNLSFNSLSGPLPSDFAQSASLVFLALEHNNLSGPVPNFWGNPSMKKLEELNLRDNRFGGHIPAAVSNDSSLRGIDLARNELGGEIPSSISDLPNLASFNVSYNNLTGAVPSSLSRKFNSTSFIGNVQLCGYSSGRSIHQCPLPPPRPKNISSLPQPEPSSEHRHKISARDIILIAAGILLAALLLLCCVLLCCLIRKRTALKKDSRGKAIPAAATAVGVGSTSSRGGEVGGGKLVHFGGPLAFTADDLLSGTAEIIGKSAYGTAYKTLLEDGNEVAVKRLREKAAKADKEFESEVAVLGRIRHPNLLPLRAYYLGPKGEKLLVFDYLPNGSLAGRGGETTTTTIDWATRMKIATGIARGLCHLHTEEKMPHGNLTATNVLLDDQAVPKVGDAGLWRLMTGGTNVVVATGGTQQGYRAPELAKADEADGKAADVYSLGVILLELLTGKSPCDAVKGMDLPEWVASAVEEDQTVELFDPELVVADNNNNNNNEEKKKKNGGGTGGGEQATRDELLNTLKLALHCVDPSPAARPDVPEIVRQLEEIHDGTTTKVPPPSSH